MISSFVMKFARVVSVASPALAKFCSRGCGGELIWIAQFWIVRDEDIAPYSRRNELRLASGMGSILYSIKEQGSLEVFLPFTGAGSFSVHSVRRA